MGRVLRLNMVNMRVRGRVWWGTGIAPPPTHPVPYPGYTPPAALALPATTYTMLSEVEYGRGAQIGSSTHLKGPILRVQGMTEVYNLLRIDRINNHSYIPGNK